MKDNNNSNDFIVGGTDGDAVPKANRRFHRSDTNSNDKFEEVDYSFELSNLKQATMRKIRSVHVSTLLGREISKISANNY